MQMFVSVSTDALIPFIDVNIDVSLAEVNKIAKLTAL